MSIFSKIERYFQKKNTPLRRPDQATSLTASSSVPVRPVPRTARPPSLVVTSPPPTKSEPVLLHTLQEKIWDDAYQRLKSEEPELVKAFESIILSEPQLDETSTEPTDRIEGKVTAELKVTSRQMRKVAEKGIERTKKEASLKQRIDRGLQAVQAIMGIMDKALRAAPEAAVIWATVCLGIEVLKNPITEALENRQGIQYVLGRIEWYWNLTSLLLDENKRDTTTAALRDALEENITRLFQKLLLYQIRSICLYHRNKAVTVLRDMFLIDDWAGQINDIQEAEKAVQHDIEQYNTQESQLQMYKLNDSTAAMQANVENIHTAVQSLAGQQAKAREDDKYNECLKDLYVTDPRTDKKSIEVRKGGLLKDSYKWILEHQDFQKFKNETDSRILWIKGDPGKGKTMLLCGIIDELESDQSISPYYFFCQATGGSGLNTATSVLRGLIYHLAQVNPQLITYVRKKYDCTGKQLFENKGAWHDVSEIATAMLKDSSLENAVLIVDALDECVVDQELLLDFIKSSNAKWIEISESPHAQLYKEVIAKVLVVYRPITLEELGALVEALKDFNREDIEEVVASCGSLFTLHNNVVSFVHQSAKDYFQGEALNQRLASGSADNTVKIWDATSASGSDDSTVKIWDATSGSDDRTVKIWDATSGACLQTLEGHDNQDLGCDFWIRVIK
ncbi:Vegetative incompatibility protein HET-E-1 [Ceratocystis platani]|uniref:Vegetative incompatibility protein HET-E-1 n=1 Tax=Ceratocystis fimbriata f. sp. platani TaxID=88771 RepID=A0A0F8B373_CERFI|nr:Vegetative incompatibility protein HET-E-1 [Ceratocystis platani]